MSTVLPHFSKYLSIAEDNDSAMGGTTDFIAGVPTGMDQFFSQMRETLQDEHVPSPVITSVIGKLQKNLVVIGEVVSIQTLSEKTVSEPENQIVHVSAIKGKDSLAFRFFDYNKSKVTLSEFQRAQNYGFIVRVTYIISPEKQNLIKSIEVIPRWTLGKK
jgi:hypothetical protein